MIHSLYDMIGNAETQSLTPVGPRCAVPLPFMGGLFDRLRDAWAVLKGFDNNGRGVAAVRWPQAGDLEAALRQAHHFPSEAQP
jgi:hypothetical protein